VRQGRAGASALGALTLRRPGGARDPHSAVRGHPSRSVSPWCPRKGRGGEIPSDDRADPLTDDQELTDAASSHGWRSLGNDGVG
jgi:hypothetical protein